MRIPSRDNALAPTASESHKPWSDEDDDHHETEFLGVDDPVARAKLLENRDRADLHLTSCAALLFLFFTVILFSLGGSVSNFSYDNDMQPATCVVYNQELQRIEDPDVDMPPDIDLPIPFKWRAEVRVHVKPDAGSRSTPFDAIALNTVRY